MIQHRITLLTLFLVLSSCTQFVQNTDDEYYQTFNTGKEEKINLMFSHNIHGETHPCGCRKFPLGGIPQVYGAIKSTLGEAPYFYVDSGDTFFPSSKIPESIHQSSRYTAIKIAESLEKLGLKIFTPGSFDFALGEEFLIKIANKHKFSFLISNSSSALAIKHKKLIHVKAKDTNLFFIGIVNPIVLPDHLHRLFSSPEKAIQEQLKEIKKLGLKNTKIVLLSHSGMDYDEKLAKKIKDFDWIIGAHSQTFLKESRDIGKTKIVQVLSRNHHLGHIQLSLNKKIKDSYKLIAVKEDLQHAVKPNPYIAWLDQMKTEVDKIQAKEQAVSHTTTSDTKYPSYIGCMDCHDTQVDFWQKTAHSLAIKTLHKAKAVNNTKCIGCHSLGFQDKKGFQTVKTIIHSEDKAFNLDSYWSEFNKKISPKKSIRELSSEDRLAFSKVQEDINTKFNVTENYANVQCLHCHQKTSDHPFDESKGMHKIDYKSACIKCHTIDQSPEWFEKDSKGLAKDLKGKYFEQKLKAVSCPKIEK